MKPHDLGSIVRYGTGKMSLMQIQFREFYNQEYKYIGVACDGGRIEVFEDRVQSATPEDRDIWNAHTNWRNNND